MALVVRNYADPGPIVIGASLSPCAIQTRTRAITVACKRETTLGAARGKRCVEVMPLPFPNEPPESD